MACEIAARPVAIFIGSSPVTKTIRMVVVAVLALSTATLLPTITATSRRTRSTAKSSSRRRSLSAQRCSIAALRPSTIPSSFKP